jgi:hypothetical protein
MFSDWISIFWPLYSIVLFIGLELFDGNTCLRCAQRAVNEADGPLELSAIFRISPVVRAAVNVEVVWSDEDPDVAEKIFSDHTFIYDHSPINLNTFFNKCYRF